MKAIVDPLISKTPDGPNKPQRVILTLSLADFALLESLRWRALGGSGMGYRDHVDGVFAEAYKKLDPDSQKRISMIRESTQSIGDAVWEGFLPVLGAFSTDNLT